GGEREHFRIPGRLWGLGGLARTVETARSSRGIIAVAPTRSQPPPVPRPRHAPAGTSPVPGCPTPRARSGALPRRSSIQIATRAPAFAGALHFPLPPLRRVHARRRFTRRPPALADHRPPSPIQDKPMRFPPTVRRIALCCSAFAVAAA